MNKCYYFVDLNEYFFRTGYKAFRLTRTEKGVQMDLVL